MVAVGIAFSFAFPLLKGYQLFQPGKSYNVQNGLEKSAHRPATNFSIMSERNQNTNIILLIPVALSVFSHKLCKQQQREVRTLNSNYIFEKIHWGQLYLKLTDSLVM